MEGQQQEVRAVGDPDQSGGLGVVLVDLNGVDIKTCRFFVEGVVRILEEGDLGVLEGAFSPGNSAEGGHCDELAVVAHYGEPSFLC